jgi:hypothetical protein
MDVRGLLFEHAKHKPRIFHRYFRHYLNLVIIWSVWFEVEKYLPYVSFLAFVSISIKNSN